MKHSVFRKFAQTKLILTCVIFFFCLVRLHAQTIGTSGDFKYYDYGTYIVIADYNGSAGAAVTIPGTINGKPVTGIGEDAFWGPGWTMTSVTIPNSVTSIADNAFSSCDGLTSVTIPNSVTSIGYAAFAQCERLTSVSIPSSVTSLGGAAFAQCIGLSSVTIPASVSSIEDETFSGCTSLTSVTIQTGVPAIGTDAFQGCTSLTSIIIPASVTFIKDSAFSGSGLTSVTVPASVTSIGNYVFQNCTSLTSVIIMNGVTSIGYAEFQGCTSLTSVIIPASVTSLGADAFASCASLAVAYFQGNAPTSFASDVFYLTPSNFFIYYSANATGFSMPTWMGYNTLVYYPGNFTYTNNGTAITITGYTGSGGAVTIPETINGEPVTSIGNSAFSGLTSLTSVTIPASVTSIGNSAFSGCISLTCAYFWGNAPGSFGSNVFSDTASNFTVYYYTASTGFSTPMWNGYQTAVIVPSGLNIPALPPWALASLVALIFLGAKTTLPKKRRTA